MLGLEIGVGGLLGEQLSSLGLLGFGLVSLGVFPLLGGSDVDGVDEGLGEFSSLGHFCKVFGSLFIIDNFRIVWPFIMLKTYTCTLKISFTYII